MNERYCVCPHCDMQWWQALPSDHIVCPVCTVDLTAAFAVSDEVARTVFVDKEVGRD